MSWRTRLSFLTAEHWSRINEVFSAAVECAPAERTQLLDRRCAQDSRLRRDVEALLDGHERAGLVDRLALQLETPIRWRAHIDAVEWRSRRVAQYVISKPLAAGAMGWVYKAHDTRLRRAVALKFLPPHLNQRPSARERFIREARAAAAVDHPNICAIHEIGETADGRMFIAMPLYSGETLQARLARSALAIDELIAIGLQIANGLSQAHERHVVHRDVKPSNIVLLPDGIVKVVDFGVAQAETVAAAEGPDRVTGTLAYMSPEQAGGEPLDHRTDIWSLGVVLYEMATGVRPFRGDGRQAVKLAILEAEPQPASAQRADLPIELDAILGTALSKSRQRRYATMAALANDLAMLAAQRALRHLTCSADVQTRTCIHAPSS